MGGRGKVLAVTGAGFTLLLAGYAMGASSSDAPPLPEVKVVEVPGPIVTREVRVLDASLPEECLRASEILSNMPQSGNELSLYAGRIADAADQAASAAAMRDVTRINDAITKLRDSRTDLDQELIDKAKADIRAYNVLSLCIEALDDGP